MSTTRSYAFSISYTKAKYMLELVDYDLAETDLTEAETATAKSLKQGLERLIDRIERAREAREKDV